LRLAHDHTLAGVGGFDLGVDVDEVLAAEAEELVPVPGVGVGVGPVVVAEGSYEVLLAVPDPLVDRPPVGVAVTWLGALRETS
jgi:hypothetical protein